WYPSPLKRRASGRSASATSTLSIAQQFVDAGFGPRPLVHGLDDDGTIKARARAVIGVGRTWQTARYHHRVGRHAAEMHLAAGEIDARRRRPAEAAQRQYRPRDDHPPPPPRRAATDEAVALDEGRLAPQRPHPPADADAARQVHVLADLGTGADRCP